MNEDTMAVLQRIERKLDLLLQALADEDEQTALPVTLDGIEGGAARDQTRSLG